MAGFNQIIKLKQSGLVIASGIMTAIATTHGLSWITWISLIPFFLVLPARTVRGAVYFGGLYGMVFIIFTCYWIIGFVNRYTGSFSLLGVPIIALIGFYYSLYPVSFSIVFTLTKNRKKNLMSSIFSKLIFLSAIWTILEWIRMNLFMGLSLIKDSVGFNMAGSMFGIQWMSIFGQWGVSFVILSMNILFAFSIRSKKYKYSLYGLLFIAFFYASGYLLYTLHNPEVIEKKKIAILHENISAETRWNENTGNMLAKNLLNLNRDAAEQKPDLIVWSESSIPWTYRSDDDLLNYSLQYSKDTDAEHIIGMLSENPSSSTRVFNSAYLMKPNGTILGHYDKRTLLSFLETPFLVPYLILSFFSDSPFAHCQKGNNDDPLVGQHGNIGILICNESVSPYEAKEMVQRGADFLVNISNDAWGEGTPLIDWHFNHCRLRAVETGKNIIVNSNRGISGIINGKGDIIIKNQSNHGDVLTGSVDIHKHRSIYSRFGDWFIYLCMFIVIVLLRFK